MVLGNKHEFVLLRAGFKFNQKAFGYPHNIDVTTISLGIYSKGLSFIGTDMS